MTLPPIHLNSVTIRGTPIQVSIPMAGQCGFDGMELWMHDAAPQRLSAADRKLGSERFDWHPDPEPVDADEIKRLAKSNGITIDGILPGSDAMLRWTGKLDEPVLSSLADAISLCAQLDARYVLLPTLGDDPSHSTVARNLREIAEVARIHGTILGIEPIGHMRTFNSVETVRDLIEQAEADDVAGIVLDAFHFFRARQQLHVLDTIPRHVIVAVQINDAMAMPIDDMVGNLHREFPGRGVFDVTAFCCKLIAIGYSGPFTIEIINPGIRSDTPNRAREACRKAYACGVEVLRVATEFHRERRH